MSSRPNFACASATAAKSASRSLTSRAIGRMASPYFCTRSSSELTSRAVAATRSPRSSAAIAHSRPKPRDVPVMNQFLDVVSVMLRRYDLECAPVQIEGSSGRDRQVDQNGGSLAGGYADVGAVVHLGPDDGAVVEQQQSLSQDL